MLYKRIRSSQQEFLSHTVKMIDQFQTRWYNSLLIKQQIDKAKLQEREQLLKENKKDTSTNIP